LLKKAVFDQNTKKTLLPFEQKFYDAFLHRQLRKVLDISVVLIEHFDVVYVFVFFWDFSSFVRMISFREPMFSWPNHHSCGSL